MIIKTEKKNGVLTYIVRPNKTDKQMEMLLNTYVKRADIPDIITQSCDIYTEDGQLLIRFRKNCLSVQNTKSFYENIAAFAHQRTSNRGSTTGGVKGEKDVRTNERTMTNIFGFFDRWSPKQKQIFSQTGIKPVVEVRECWFNTEYPEKYKKTIPLIQEISRLYKQHAPTFFKKQYKKAKETNFRIANTAFTTVTTNINFQTTIHRDSGDDSDGFGNLVVFEKGEYTGGETCMPQYGIGVDVRNQDILFMDVHQPHGNLPLKLKKDSERLSIVCYLRKGVWEKTRNRPGLLQKFHATMKRIQQYKSSKTKKRARR